MIDWDRVAEMRDEIGAEEFGEVIDLFLLEVQGAIAALPDVQGDAAEMERQLHFLKGAAMNLGFSALSSLCAKGETDCAAGRYDTITPAEVDHCFAQSRKAFESEYDRRFAA